MIQAKALAIYRLERTSEPRRNWHWTSLGEDTRHNCYIQLQKYNFQLGLNITESYLFINCIISACYELISEYQAELIVWGIIPHSLFDYAFMKTAQSCGIKQLLFQEFSYCRNGSFMYTPDLEIVPRSEKDCTGKNALTLEDAERMAMQVLAKGKAALCDSEVALGAVRTYVPNGFEIDVSRAYLNARGSEELDCINSIENYYRMTGEVTSLGTTKTVLTERLSRLRSKGYKKFMVLFLSSEPELTISPMCRELSSSFEFMLQLLEFLPAEYALFIKEHPGVILERLPENKRPWTKQLQDVRPKELIGQINNCDRIEWCPMSTGLLDLKRHGVSLLATTAGTVGYEGIILGIPVICRASTPYAHLPCSYRIGNEREERTFDDFAEQARRYLDNTSPAERSHQIIRHAFGITPMIANGELYKPSEKSNSASEENLRELIRSHLISDTVEQGTAS